MKEKIDKIMEVLKLDSYTTFASVYDEFMDNVPYDEWSKRIHNILCEHNINSGLVLDLGCGTGTMTEKLASYGYDMIGVDNSVEMLNIAQEKRKKSNCDILYLHQDMSKLELYGTVRAVVCVCDSINYILEKAELVEVFSLINNYLDPEGLFIFDFNTEHKYENVIGNRIIAENRKDKSFIWENYYHKYKRLNEMELTLFIRKDGDLFTRSTELHYQKAYSLAEMKQAIEKSGLKFLSAYDGYLDMCAIEGNERIIVVAKEVQKEKAVDATLITEKKSVSRVNENLDQDVLETVNDDNGGQNGI